MSCKTEYSSMPARGIQSGNLKLHLLAGMILVLFLYPAQTYRVCSNEDIPLMQTSCKYENTEFSEANKHDNHTEICSRLYEMWFCVARSVPQCFQNYTFFYQSYLHSPHNCKPTPEQLKELQQIRKEALDKINVVPLDSSTNSATYEVTDSHVTKSEEGDGSHVTKSTTAEVGEHSSHTGTNKGIYVHGNSVLVIGVVSIVTLIQLFNKNH